MDLYQTKSVCQTPLEKQYHAEIVEMERCKRRQNRRIFTCTDFDRFTNWEEVGTDWLLYWRSHWNRFEYQVLIYYLKKKVLILNHNIIMIWRGFISDFRVMLVQNTSFNNTILNNSLRHPAFPVFYSLGVCSCSLNAFWKFQVCIIHSNMRRLLLVLAYIHRPL